MPTEDLSQLLPGEGEPQQPAVEQQPEPQPEPYRLKYRGEEREIPHDPVNGLAEALGTTPEGVINALQRAREADRIARENIRIQQELEEIRSQQQQAAQYQERLGGGQAPQPRSYQPQYREPQYQQPQPQPGDEDPIAMLRELRQGLNMTQRQFSEFIEAQQQMAAANERAREEAMALQHGQQIQSQLERYLHEKNNGRREPIDLNEFAEEVYLSGGGNRHVPIEHAMERAWLWMTRDEQFQAARNETLEKLQNKRAVVTIPGARGSGAPAPSSRASDSPLGDTNVLSILDSIPQR